MDSLAKLVVISVLVLLLANLQCQAHVQLSPTFYDRTCPKGLRTIRNTIKQAVSCERRMAASLIRLHFHDCFVRGCDGSVLLDETPSIQSEKTSLANNNSARDFEVIEAAKRQVEKICPGVVSCADILSVAARDASVAVGGPTWQVKFGRRDSTTTSRYLVDANLPSPFADLRDLIDNFARQGLNAREMVALSGSHTIGQAQCTTFRGRIYSNGTDIDAGLASTRRRQCPKQDGVGDSKLAPLDLVTPNSFDNNYFKNLMRKKGLLISDQVLFNGGSTDNIVSEYSRNPKIFLLDFASAMVKMGDIEPLTGRNGIIRKICGRVN